MADLNPQNASPFSRLYNMASDTAKLKMQVYYDRMTQHFLSVKQVSPQEAVRNLHMEMDEKIKTQLAQKGAKPISCTKGCSFCCYLHIVIAKSEAELLAKHVTPEMIPALQFQAKAETYEQWNKIQPHKKKQCVFLKDGECSIYNDRPSSCRKYMVVTKPRLCNVEFKINKVLIQASAEAEILAGVIQTQDGEGSMAKMLLELVTHG